MGLMLFVMHGYNAVKSLQRRLVIVRVRIGEDLLGVPEGHGYSRSVREPQPVGDRCGRVRRNVDIVESRCNGPQLCIFMMMMMYNRELT